MILSGGCLLKFKALMSVFSSALQSARVCLGICRFVFFIEFCLRSLFCLVRMMCLVRLNAGWPEYRYYMSASTAQMIV